MIKAYYIINTITEIPFTVRDGAFLSKYASQSRFSFGINMIIYKATNLINGKIYIGQTTMIFKKRKLSHLYEMKATNKTHYFSNALNKYGFDNFKWEVICICPNIAVLNKQEQYYITFLNSMNKNVGYNLTNGGLNALYSKEAKLKMSKAQSGINNPRYGIKVSKETRLKMSIKRKERRGVNTPGYSKYPSIEVRKKMSDSHKIVVKKRGRNKLGRFIKIKDINNLDKNL